MVRAVTDEYMGHVRQSPHSACGEDDKRIPQGEYEEDGSKTGTDRKKHHV